MTLYAPEGQPTENVRTVLDNARKDLDFWDARIKDAERDLARCTRARAGAFQSVVDWEERLRNRLADEEKDAREVNGL